MPEETLAANIKAELGPLADTIQHFMREALTIMPEHEITNAVLQNIIWETMEKFQISEQKAWLLSYGLLRK